jgi:hypothetical protein
MLCLPCPGRQYDLTSTLPHSCCMQAKCGAPLRVELVDDTGACVMEGLPPGMQLEIHVLNGEKYKVWDTASQQLQHCRSRHL